MPSLINTEMLWLGINICVLHSETELSSVSSWGSVSSTVLKRRICVLRSCYTFLSRDVISVNWIVMEFVTLREKRTLTLTSSVLYSLSY
jgi:hypothetical protein